MKGLPKHIRDVDSFYKAKSEDDFMPELPENLWDEIALHIPSSPLPTYNSPTTQPYPRKKGGTGAKGINFYHGTLFYAAGLLSAVLLYTAYIHLTHQENTSTLQITSPTFDHIKTAPTDSTGVSGMRKGVEGDHSTPNSTNGREKRIPAFSKTTKVENGLKTAKEESRHEAAILNPGELPTDVSHTPSSQTSEQIEKSESTKKEATTLPVHLEEQADFYQKHSKKAKDSLSKQLFIPKK